MSRWTHVALGAVFLAAVVPLVTLASSSGYDEADRVQIILSGLGFIASLGILVFVWWEHRERYPKLETVMFRVKEVDHITTLYGLVVNRGQTGFRRGRLFLRRFPWSREVKARVLKYPGFRYTGEERTSYAGLKPKDNFKLDAEAIADNMSEAGYHGDTGMTIFIEDRIDRKHRLARVTIPVDEWSKRFEEREDEDKP